MAECKRKTNIDDCYAHVANHLAQSERDILSMIDDVYKAMAKGGLAASQDFRPSAITGSPEARFGDVAPFLRDLKSQLNDFRSLMGTFTKYSQVKPGFWDTY